mgnify:CR=1 FL=1
MQNFEAARVKNTSKGDKNTSMGCFPSLYDAFLHSEGDMPVLCLKHWLKYFRVAEAAGVGYLGNGLVGGAQQQTGMFQAGLAQQVFSLRRRPLRLVPPAWRVLLSAACSAGPDRPSSVSQRSPLMRLIYNNV